MLVEARADRDVANAVVALPVVLRRVAGPRGECDLVAETLPADRLVERGAEHADRLLVVEVLKLGDGRGRDLRPPPEHDRAVLLVVHDLPRVDGVGVEAPDGPEPVV